MKPDKNIDTSVLLFKALADGSRLRILSALMDAPKYVEIISERLELAPSTVSFHLKKLEDAGLVEKIKDQYYIVYSLKKEVLDLPLSHWIGEEHGSTDAESLREEAYRQKVIETFFKFNQLKSIPVQRKKRLIVLEHLANAFEFNKTYTEREVNIIIADYHDDFATLRRELINERLLTRENGIYQRVSEIKCP